MSRVTNAIVIDAPQRSDKWFAARLGNVTGSEAEKAVRATGLEAKHAAIRKMFNMASVSAKFKTSDEYTELISLPGFELFEKAEFELPDNDTRIAYRKSRVIERLTGMPPEDKFISKAMLWGQMNEKLAVAKYQMETGNKVDEAFFLLHPELRCGASPDGHVTDCVTGELGVLEVKCLESHNHLYKIMRTQEVPDDYFVQMQMEMWLANVDYCDFVGYDSRLPGKLDIFIKRVKRDDFYIDNVLEPEIIAFLEEVDKDERFFRMKARTGFGFNLEEYRGLVTA